MWTSRQTKMVGTTLRGNAQLGVVTAGGQENGVHLGTERRWLPVMAPGGYRWRPQTGEQVLVMKTGVDDESACVLARQEGQGDDLLPGEVELYARNCGMKLTNGGNVELRGTVLVNGTALEELIRVQVASALSRQEG